MFSWFKHTFLKRHREREGVNESPPGPAIISRSEHGISRANISENALKVLYRLSKAGYESYLVGGGVRDLLLGREPKDFDVATNATPEEVKKLFRNCRLIGRRFRLAHVHFGREIIEVATFRASRGEGEGEGRVEENGMILRDNVYGTLEEDAWRRDFTANALYYNIKDFSVVDHTGGMADLKAGVLRVVGDPGQRFREDPVRMLRAVRFAGKLGFRIEGTAEASIYELGHLLEDVASARLFDEVLKLFLGGFALQTFELLRHYQLFAPLFPETEECLSHEEQHFPLTLVANALANTDSRLEQGKPVTPAFLFAALLWEPVRRQAEAYREKGKPPLEALQLAGDGVVARQVKRVAFPKRFTLQAREIWTMQHRLTRLHGKRPFLLLDHPRFRAAYDFLLLRKQSGEDVGELADWWTRFQEEDEAGRQAMVQQGGKGRPSRPRRRRRPRGRDGRNSRAE